MSENEQQSPTRRGRAERTAVQRVDVDDAQPESRKIGCDRIGAATREEPRPDDDACHAWTGHEPTSSEKRDAGWVVHEIDVTIGRLDSRRLRRPSPREHTDDDLRRHRAVGHQPISDLRFRLDGFELLRADRLGSAPQCEPLLGPQGGERTRQHLAQVGPQLQHEIRASDH
ncbi:MAG TPA: hypothetical protein PLZ93_00710 [Nocardioides sp.]|nr:hypothetical protein [Nocardioides sp.]